MNHFRYFLLGLGLWIIALGCGGGGPTPSQKSQKNSAALEAEDSSTKTEPLCAKYTNESAMGNPIIISSTTIPSALKKLTEHKWTRKTVTEHILSLLSNANFVAGKETREIWEELEMEWKYDSTEHFPLGLAGVLNRYYKFEESPEEFDHVQMAIFIKEQRRRIDKEGLGLEGEGQIDFTTYDLQISPDLLLKDLYISSDPNNSHIPSTLAMCEDDKRKTFEGIKK